MPALQSEGMFAQSFHFGAASGARAKQQAIGGRRHDGQRSKSNPTL
jgi:hypothetical protein